MKRARVLFSLIIFILSLTLSVIAQIPSITREAYLTGLSSPVHITNAGDGTNRMFVVQQRGLIRVVQPGSTTPTTFIDLSSKVSQTGNERGLLGLAFHPDFENNSFFFVNYTRPSDGATVVERYEATNNNTTGDINTAQNVITISQDFSNHNGGHIEYGPDGNLYIGMGDGGSGNDPNNRAQNINSLLGKMLRITPTLADTAGANPYTIPADNPYVGINGADEIYAIGLRNPYRWSFDRGGTNQLWTGDVGQNAIEEVTIVIKGGNYGWRVYEGNSCTNNDPGACNPNNFDPPEFQYDHSQGRCSITGGYVYRGTQGTLPLGAYMYGDFCSGQYYYWDGTNQNLIEDGPNGFNISSFGQDEAGELYVVSRSGTVEKIVNSASFVNNASADFDGDGTTDLSVYRPSDGVWYSLNTSDAAVQIRQFGLNDDIPTPEDFDGDNITDIGVFRPSNGVWYSINSGDNTIEINQFGATGDIPTAGDYDGDNSADIAVFRPSTGEWFVTQSSNSSIVVQEFGVNGDVPTTGDFDGDGRYDFAVWRPSNGTWYQKSTANSTESQTPFGSSGDIPASGDFDGDDKNDFVLFRPSTGVWYVFNSSNSSVDITQFGLNGDIPVVGDYDGDGDDNIAVYRPSTGVWYAIQDQGVLISQFGLNGDEPAPKYDTP